MPLKTHRLLTSALAGVVLAAGATVPALGTPALGAPASASTSTAEKRRVDAVPTPKLGWYKCFDIAECATVRLPLDYDQPRGATTEVAVLRVKAKDQKHKIGSLFLNPGGPGGSGTGIALAAPEFLSDSLLQKFDIVGVDPRGIASSENVKCFKSVKDQTAVQNLLSVPFPVTKAEEQAYVKGSKLLGKACSTTGKPLSGSMSTAEVARDMDVLRRAVGDKKLNYLGFSYGTALGQYYANMFPDRFRALVVDGVLNPQEWTGSNTKQILDARLRSSDGAYAALIEILKRCDRAGETKCVFAAGDPVKRFDAIAKRLLKKPVVVTDEGGTFTITYAVFVSAILGSLYSPFAGEDVTAVAAEVQGLIDGGSATAVLNRIHRAQATKSYDFPYDNGFEASSAVICTDGLHPRDAGAWPALTAQRDREAPYFGRSWGWIDSQCARDTWTVRDEDAYVGPFTKRTAAPVLVVGSIHDPATNYAGAVSSSRLLPNSRLLSSNNWGHTGYGTGPCVTAAIDAYLLTGKPPAKGTFCTDAPQPFTEPLPTDTAAKTLSAVPGKKLPPVVSIRPDSILLPAA
jgi:pimeloyl-ACP methyl ester carboxylesterase